VALKAKAAVFGLPEPPALIPLALLSTMELPSSSPVKRLSAFKFDYKVAVDEAIEVQPAATAPFEWSTTLPVVEFKPVMFASTPTETAKYVAAAFPARLASLPSPSTDRGLTVVNLQGRLGRDVVHDFIDRHRCRVRPSVRAFAPAGLC
jgi:hypothetical protein